MTYRGTLQRRLSSSVGPNQKLPRLPDTGRPSFAALPAIPHCCTAVLLPGLSPVTRFKSGFSVTDSRITWAVHENVLVIQLLDHDLLHHSATEAVDLITTILRKSPDADVILSLRGIDFLSSLGISTLLSIRAQLMDQSRNLCLIEAAAMVTEVFRVTRLNQLLLFASDEADGRARLAAL